MDKLKQYLQDNREKLDLEPFPVEENLGQILYRLSDKKNKLILYKWVAAASIIFLLGSVIYLLPDKNPDAATLAVAPVARDTNQLNLPIISLKDSIEINSQKTALITRAKNPSSNRKTNSVKRMEKKNKLTDFDQMNLGFQTMIDMQLQKVRTTAFYAENADYFSSFKKQFNILEKEEATLKMSLRQFDISDERLNTLINIYQGKLSLLKQLQIEIQKMNNRVNQLDPEVRKSKPVYVNI